MNTTESMRNDEYSKPFVVVRDEFPVEMAIINVTRRRSEGMLMSRCIRCMLSLMLRDSLYTTMYNIDSIITLLINEELQPPI